MKNKILLLTDFSENAYNAALYACSIAKSRNLDIHILHYYTVKSSFFEEDEDKGMRDHSKFLKADLEIIALYEKLERVYPDLKITISCERGMLSDKLPQETKKDIYELIVMGAKGESAQQSVFWGATTAMITDISTIPVLVVPKNYTEFRKTNIGLLTNYKPEELETLKNFLSIGGDIQQLSMLHVHRAHRDLTVLSEKMDSWIFNITEWDGVNNVDYRFAQIKDTDESLDSVPEVINTLLLENKLDIILVTKTRRSFFKRAFEPSVSKTIAQELVIPSFFDK